MSLQRHWNKFRGLLMGTGKTTRMVEGVKTQLEKTDTPVLIICRDLNKSSTARIRYLLDDVDGWESRVHFTSFRSFVRDASITSYEEGANIRMGDGIIYDRHNVFIDHECYEMIIDKYVQMTQSLYKQMKELFE